MAEKLIPLLPYWTDFDIAAFRIGVRLGIFEDSHESFALVNKWRFYSENKMGRALYDLLDAMVDENILEQNEDGQYRSKK